MEMDLEDLQAHLTGNAMTHGQRRLIASKCIDGLLSVGLEYTMRRAEKAENVQIPHLDEYLERLTTIFKSYLLQLKNINKDFKNILQKMSDDIDVSQGHANYVDIWGQPLLDEPTFSDEFVELWIKARVPELVGLESKTLEVHDVSSGIFRIKSRLTVPELFTLFIKWSNLAKKDLDELKLIRANEGSKTLIAKVNHDAWLVQSVASLVRNVGGKNADILEIAQAIAKWADPGRTISYQWGRAALKRIK